MAARYVDPGNVVAQGQSFYTGLLPGSYEKGAGGGGGSNVYGKGSGGSAGVSADRTASEAGTKSIKDYKAGGSFLGTQPMTDSDRLDKIAKNTAIPSAGGGGGGGQGKAAIFGSGSDEPQGENPWAGPYPRGSRRPKQADETSNTAPPLPDPAHVEKAIMGQWNGSVQRRASTRAQTRQTGVQQSATHKSFLYPNMANSTDRSLNF